MSRLNYIASAAFRRRPQARNFRSESALDALQSFIDDDDDNPNKTLVLYNYPSFSGAYAALFAHRRLPSALILPFSSVEPLRIEDFEFGGGLKNCYLLDFIGPKNFALELSQIIPRVIAFDHRESSAMRIKQLRMIPGNLELHVDTSICSVRAVHDYFSKGGVELFDDEDGCQVSNVLRYIEDLDLRRFELCDIEAFKIGIREEMGRLNCVTNPSVFEQLMKLDCDELIAKGKSYVNSRQDAANELLGKTFRIRLGRGTYGECLATRADGNSNLSHEMCLELSRRSEAAGLRPIGAAIFMQRNKNLKMRLRSINGAADTSEIARAYGGGGKPSSSSFIIRMDEYNHWTAAN
ncbi:uncharacterized protein A4U43_C09F1660 [Asparagus officinalis]|uniref:DHHA1 domain-containing protein n=1 Tax=Asparagus officinalis TaxID=4686 RepID=A0A5P1E4H0_ASPOF|nr:uncharacterized protein LOC109824032 [Asparagus officinalis]ONK57552.1 uncharacterized protein A4U43_C09F1660 [Asparagus officinalis]